MKIKLNAILCAVVLIGHSSMAHADPLVVTMTPKAIFAPTGFDSNDNAQIVLFGVFNDVCHKLAPVDFTIDQTKQKIYVNLQAYTTKICAEIWVDLPYSVTLNLGALQKGKYQIYLKDASGKYNLSNSLPIAEARLNGSTDDHTYAQIDDIQVLKTSDPTTKQLILNGTVNNTCLALDEVQVNFTVGNIYDVLPILTRITGECTAASIPFQKTIILNQVPASPTLVNIRSMGGQSIEKVLYQLPGVLND